MGQVDRVTVGSIRRGRRIGFWPMYSSHHVNSGTLDLYKLICIVLISTDGQVEKKGVSV